MKKIPYVSDNLPQQRLFSKFECCVPYTDTGTDLATQYLQYTDNVRIRTDLGLAPQPWSSAPLALKTLQTWHIKITLFVLSDPTFHFDADPDPTPSFAHLGRSDFLKLSFTVSAIQMFRHHHRCHNF
jgi:hypothetical protein